MKKDKSGLFGVSGKSNRDTTRKSRYLAISMNAKDTSKAIRCLDNVLSYFNAAYKIDVGKDIPIKCDPLPLSVLKAIS